MAVGVLAGDAIVGGGVERRTALECPPGKPAVHPDDRLSSVLAIQVADPCYQRELPGPLEGNKWR